MAYILGYIVADGCIISTRNNTSDILNITSKDYSHLNKIKKVLYPSSTISRKKNSSGGFGFQIQIRNSTLCGDLRKLGITPRKTYTLNYFRVPQKMFSHFARGFFDGDGTVYIYMVNGTPQIKAGFVSASKKFLYGFTEELSKSLGLNGKKIHTKKDEKGIRAVTYYSYYYVKDCIKLEKLFYSENSNLYLERKKEVFNRWSNTLRREYKTMMQ